MLLAPYEYEIQSYKNSKKYTYMANISTIQLNPVYLYGLLVNYDCNQSLLEDLITFKKIIRETVYLTGNIRSTFI